VFDVGNEGIFGGEFFELFDTTTLRGPDIGYDDARAAMPGADASPPYTISRSSSFDEFRKAEEISAASTSSARKSSSPQKRYSDANSFLRNAARRSSRGTETLVCCAMANAPDYFFAPARRRDSTTTGVTGTS
jgi:hypothetical protein